MVRTMHFQKKRCIAMLLAMIPLSLTTVGAAEVKGDWTTYRFADEYCDDTCDHGNGACYYRPEAGYKYTAEGFTSAVAKSFSSFSAVILQER